MAIAIIVDERTTSPPRFPRSGDAGLFRDLSEHSILVVKKPVLAVVRDVEVFPTVVVIVADANALSPARCGESGLNGHVGECAVMVVSIETIARTLPGRKSFEPGAIYEKNVRPAVVVVIEDGDASACGLDDVFLGIKAAENIRRGEASLLRVVGKVGDWRRRRDCLCLLRGSQRTED